MGSSISTSTSSSSSFSSSDSFLDRKSSLSSELDELLYKAMNMSWRDKARMFREFYYPYHISLTGNYYPRYKITGGMESGTSHVSYLARPYYSYHVPSCYRGFSVCLCPKDVGSDTEASLSQPSEEVTENPRPSNGGPEQGGAIYVVVTNTGRPLCSQLI